MPNLLKTARARAGKTQARVAMDAGVSEAMYQRYEYGRSEPGVRTAIRIADALGVTDLRELFAEAPGDRQAHHDDTTS